MEYVGFVYIWFDTKRRMFYIGSHKGSADDYYIGSGIRFKKAYAKRPTTFKRRILEFVTGEVKDIQAREQAWLNLIDDSELGDRYYNLKKNATGGSKAGSSRKPCSEETKLKISLSNKGKRKTQEYKEILSNVVAKKYTFVHQHTGEQFVGSVRNFAVKFFSLEKRASVANAAYQSQPYKGWKILT